MAQPQSGGNAGGNGTAVDIDAQAFLERVARLYTSWKSHKDSELWNGADSLVINVENDEEQYQKCTAMHLWLFGYEFPDTIIVFCSNAVKILSSQKKVSILKGKLTDLTTCVVPVEFIIKDKEPAKDYKTLIDFLNKSGDGKTFGALPKQKAKGKYLEGWLKELQATKLKEVDISFGLSDLLAIKDAKEQKHIKTAGTISAFVLKSNLVPEIETVIDQNKTVKHSALADKIEQIFEDPSKISKKLQKDQVDTCYPPIIQSGGRYDLRPSATSDDSNLHFGTIVCSLGAKYKSYCTNVARTYLVDPTPVQNETYQLLFDIEQMLISMLKPGTKLSALYNKATDMIKAQKSELVEKFTKNCGFGIGLEFKESVYTITGKNDKVIKAGMVFNLALGFENVKMPESSKYPVFAVFIADTLLVKEDGNAEILTDKAPKKLADITYYLETEGPEEKGSGNSAVKSEPKRMKDDILSQIVESRFRETTVQRKEEKEKMKESEQKRREHQKMLEEKQREEAAARFSSSSDPKGKGKLTVTKDFDCYKDPSSFPSDMSSRNKIHVDNQRECILVPIYGLMVPFHVSTIKNATKTDEEFLRINFVTPDATAAASKTNESIKFPKSIRVKELTYKFKSDKELNNTLRLIKELRKRFNTRETQQRENASLIVQEKLVITKGRAPRLNDVFIRPNPIGRRTTGSLEAHVNGFRFTMKKGEPIDVSYKNIKHAFFQPAEKDLIVLIHFHLHNPIMVGKKKTQDIQFCTEVVEVSQSLDGRRYDADEIEEEQRERQMRMRLNQEFQNFVKKVEEVSQSLEFDMPYRDLGFFGVPNRSSVFLQPTVHCLVNLTETPFFVLSLEDVEIAYFERVQFSLKNFDLVFVFKDYNRPVAHINVIAVDFLDTIKEWLDQCDIKYYEGTQNMNWTRIMQAINADPVKFHKKDGGWGFLNNESDSEDDQENEQESDFEAESDAYDDDDDEDEDDDSAVSDNDEYQDAEDDVGEDWDELEAKALEQDSKREEKKRGRGGYSDDEDDSDDDRTSRKKRR